RAWHAGFGSKADIPLRPTAPSGPCPPFRRRPTCGGPAGTSAQCQQLLARHRRNESMASGADQVSNWWINTRTIRRLLAVGREGRIFIRRECGNPEIPEVVSPRQHGVVSLSYAVIEPIGKIPRRFILCSFEETRDFPDGFDNCVRQRYDAMLA